VRSPAALNPLQPSASPMRLSPSEVTAPTQSSGPLGAVFPARMVAFRVVVPAPT
jgi:hypothetical protein